MYKFNTNITRYLLLVILILGLFSIPSCRYFERYGFFSKRSLKKAILWAKQDSARVADSLKRSGIVNNTSEEVKQDSLQKSTERKLSVEGKKNKYHIIVGSFTNTDNAKLRAREYFNKGYKTAIILTTDQNGKKIEMVSVRSFANIDNAKKFLTDFKRNTDSTAWVYSKN